LWEAAKEKEMKIPWKEVNEGSSVSEGSIKKDSGGEDWTDSELDWTQ
jgi:hypothetical protein